MASQSYIHITIDRDGEHLIHKGNIWHIHLTEITIQIESGSSNSRLFSRITKSEFEQIKQELSQHRDLLRIQRCAESISFLNLNCLEHFREYLKGDRGAPDEQYVCIFRYLNQEKALEVCFDESITARVKAHLLEHQNNRTV